MEPRPIVWVLGALALVSCSREASESPRGGASEVEPAGAGDIEPGPAPESAPVAPRGGTPAPPAPAKPEAVVGCALPGAGWSMPCSGPRGAGGMAFDGSGRLYLVDPDGGARRYRVELDGACRLREDRSFADGGRLPQPEIEPEPQSLDGPVQLRSGGPDYRLASGDGDVMYWHDFLTGIHRIDRGRLEPVCPRRQGVRALTWAEGALIAAGSRELFRLRPDRRCAEEAVAVSASLSFPRPAWLDGALHVGGVSERRHVVMRLDAAGAAETTYGGGDAFEPGGLCSISAVIGCGGDVCVIDGNCQKLNRYGRDGALIEEQRLGTLAGGAVSAVAGAATAPDGAMWLSVMVRENPGGRECAARLVRLEPAR